MRRQPLCGDCTFSLTQGSVLQRDKSTCDCSTIGFADLALTDIHPSALQGLWKLKTLDLSGNNLKLIHQETWSNLTSLRVLDLSENRISYIAKGAFSSLRSLEALWLQKNAISWLPGNLFAGLENLLSLSLSQNQIETLQLGAFNSLHRLAWLDLSFNLFTEIDWWVWKPIEQSLKGLSLADTPKMDCTPIIPDTLEWWDFSELRGGIRTFATRIVCFPYGCPADAEKVFDLPGLLRGESQPLYFGVGDLMQYIRPDAAVALDRSSLRTGFYVARGGRERCACNGAPWCIYSASPLELEAGDSCIPGDTDSRCPSGQCCQNKCLALDDLDHRGALGCPSTCEVGFESFDDGRTCTDMQECATRADNCDAHAMCLNNNGSFTCTCADGWKSKEMMPSGVVCENIDECDESSDKCQQFGETSECQDTEGSFMCSGNLTGLDVIGPVNIEAKVEIESKSASEGQTVALRNNPFLGFDAVIVFPVWSFPEREGARIIVSIYRLRNQKEKKSSKSKKNDRRSAQIDNSLLIPAGSGMDVQPRVELLRPAEIRVSVDEDMDDFLGERILAIFRLDPDQIWVPMETLGRSPNGRVLRGLTPSLGAFMAMVVCPGGTIATANVSVCAPCPSGYFSNAGDAECSECPGGMNSNPSSAECLPATCDWGLDCICSKEEASTCHEHANCIGTWNVIAIPPEGADSQVSHPDGSDGTYKCSCGGGYIGHGYGLNGCAARGYTVRVVYINTAATPLSEEEERNLLFFMDVTCSPASTNSCNSVRYTQLGDDTAVDVMFRGTVDGLAAAERAASSFNAVLKEYREWDPTGKLPPSSRVDPNIGAKDLVWNLGICPAGTIAAVEDGVCEPCPAGYFSDAGDADCSKCPGGFHSDPGATTHECLPAKCDWGIVCNCGEDEASTCHMLADCTGTWNVIAIPSAPGVVSAEVAYPPGSDGTYTCSCGSDYLGHGYGPNGCDDRGYAVRILYLNTFTSPVSEEEENNVLSLMSVNCTLGSLDSCDHVHYIPTGNDTAVNVLFKGNADGLADAERAAASFNAMLEASRRSDPNAIVPQSSRVDPSIGARVYTWDAGHISGPIAIPPSGMELRTVHFEENCAQTGCWVLGVRYTTGSRSTKLETMNSFFLPYVHGNDALSYDYAYSKRVLDSFQPAKFPCRVSDYVAADGNVASLPTKATACCFGLTFDLSATGLGGDESGAGVLGQYRVTNSFASYATEVYPQLCPGGIDSPAITATTPKPEDLFPDGVRAGNHHAGDFLATGQKFVGMPHSPGVTETVTIDAYFGWYDAIIKLDERELRTRAGMLRGTVGVEHTVDFFLGYLNLKPATTSWVLDSMATQASVHVEKTNFFSVSTHGTNDYTFIEYVNLRLVAVYTEDTGLGVDSSVRTERTSPVGAAEYVQVTFTLGSKYGINSNSDLIPLSSVRAGKGVFFDSSELHHKCLEYTDTPDNEFNSLDAISRFNASLDQDCGPAAVMCSSPGSIPDSFVAFNIPLGFDFFGPGSNTLDNVVFVQMVISAIDEDARAGTGSQPESTDPNSGEAPWQMKTTLTASIPVINGGVNIFCDAVSAKTDLKDVANVDMIIGSAMNLAELSRLRIFEDIAGSKLDPGGEVQIDSDSIEAGLMTLVIKGNSSYFQNPGLNNRGVSIELEDVITVHLMESDGSTADGAGAQGKQQLIKELLAESTDDADRYDDAAGGGEGYALNGAFSMRIDRSSQRAHLEPSPRLLSVCPMNPPRPSETRASVLETCVSRRDVRFRDFPWRVGAESTAMEITHTASDSSLSSTSTESRFLTTIFGDSEYARELATRYAAVIDQKYGLDGRYKRAYWINPGYEWAPTQTGGASVFQLSQKIFLFALVALDEKIASNPGSSIFDSMSSRPPEDVGSDGATTPNLPKVPPASRRRALLAVDGAQTPNSLSSAEISFPISRGSVLATAYGVPLDRVASYEVVMTLTAEEACLSDAELQQQLYTTFMEHLAKTASLSSIADVQIVSLVVSGRGAECGGGAAPTRRLLQGSSPSVKMVMAVIFKVDEAPSFDLQSFSSLPAVQSISTLSGGALDSGRPGRTPVYAGDTIPFSEPASSPSASSMPVAVVAGVAAGAGLLCAGVAMFVWHRWATGNRSVEVKTDSATYALRSELQLYVPSGGESPMALLQHDKLARSSSSAHSLPNSPFALRPETLVQETPLGEEDWDRNAVDIMI